MKSKEIPRDIDVLLLFRSKDYKKIEEISYEIIKLGKKINLNLHVESIIADNLHKEKIYSSVLHEGFSIRNNKFINELLGFEAYSLVTYSLKDKPISEKVRFSYALYGRKKGAGFLASVGGKEIGKAAIIVPVSKEEPAKEFFNQWEILFKMQRLIIIK